MSSISLSPRDAVDLPSLKLYQHVSIDSLRFVLSVIFYIHDIHDFMSSLERKLNH